MSYSNHQPQTNGSYFFQQQTPIIQSTNNNRSRVATTYTFLHPNQPMRVISNPSVSTPYHQNGGMWNYVSCQSSDRVIPYPNYLPPTYFPTTTTTSSRNAHDIDMRRRSVHDSNNTIRPHVTEKCSHPDSETVDAALALTLMNAKYKEGLDERKGVVGRTTTTTIATSSSTSQSLKPPQSVNHNPSHIYGSRPSNAPTKPETSHPVMPKLPNVPTLPTLPPLPFSSHHPTPNPYRRGTQQRLDNQYNPLCTPVSTLETHSLQNLDDVLQIHNPGQTHDLTKKIPPHSIEKKDGYDNDKHNDDDDDDDSEKENDITSFSWLTSSIIPLSNYHQSSEGISICLALPDDQDMLSPLHCFMRQHCIEAFVLRKKDKGDDLTNTAALTSSSSTNCIIATDTNSREYNVQKNQEHSTNTKVKYGVVGIRCAFCKNIPFKDRAERSITYPSTVSNIYYSAETWQRRHASNCQCIPDWAKMDLSRFAKSSKGVGGGRRGYWGESANRLGMVDTENGIQLLDSIERSTTTQFEKDPSHGTIRRPSPPLCLPNEQMSLHDDTISQPTSTSIKKPSIVTKEDEGLVNDFLFTLVSQMEACEFTEEDRSGGRSKVKTYEVGYPGLQCKHCCGKAGYGRYFPASSTALNLANSDRNIYNHLMKCRKCPKNIKEKLASLCHSKKKRKVNKRGKGGRKEFFQRVWNRLHGNSPKMCVAYVSSRTLHDISPNSNIDIPMYKL